MMDDRLCVSCGQVKDTFTTRCSECLHKHRRYYYLAKGRFDLASEVSDRPYAWHWTEPKVEAEGWFPNTQKEKGKC